MERIEVIVRKNDLSLARYLLAPGEYVVGRDADCEIQIDCPDVSRHHARLTISAEDCKVEDLASTSGTWFDGEPVSKSACFKAPKAIQIGGAMVHINTLTEAELLALTVTVEPKPAPAPHQPPAAPAGPTLPPSVKAIQKPRNYVVGRELSHGGMGAVLEAQDLNIDRAVAMKVILPAKAGSPAMLQRFIREAQVLGRLEHPNIVPIHELGTDEAGRVFYTMKYVKGETLQRVLDQIKAGEAETIRKYPLSQLLTVFQKVCDAVGFAHSKGVVHRDLKPENIMLGEFGEVLVMDWGIAKILESSPFSSSSLSERLDSRTKDEDEQMLGPQTQRPDRAAEQANPIQTLEGQIMGTPNFMAPEQAAGRVKDIDARTDIYALGGILYQLLTLRPPILGPDLPTILELIRAGDIRPPCEFNERATTAPPFEAKGEPFPHCPGGRIPAPLSSVAMKALTRRRSQRYQSVLELQRDISAYQGGFATQAEQAGLYKLTTLWINRHRLAAAAISAITVLATILVITTLTNKRTIDTTLNALRETAPHFIERARDHLAQQHLEAALEAVNRAVALMPRTNDYHLLKGHILQSLLRFESARNAYQTVIDLDPTHTNAAENLKLSAQISAARSDEERLSLDNFSKLHELMLRQERWSEAQMMLQRRLAKDEQLRTTHLAKWREHLRQTGIRGSMEIDHRGWLRLDLSNTGITNLLALKGMPVNWLSLNGTRVSDLTPLRGLPLKSLMLQNLRDVPAIDITPLRGLRLEELWLMGEHTNIGALQGMPLKHLTFHCQFLADIRPLRGAPLEMLEFWGPSRIANLGPLQGTNLKHLHVDRAPLSDLAPLRGMKLHSLQINSTAVRDLSPLKGMELHLLHIGDTKITDLAILKEWPSLGDIVLDGLRIHDGGVLEHLQLLNFLSLARAALTDIEVLKGKRITSLNLQATGVRDLQPLVGMPIEQLDLSHTKVTDLTPLKFMPLIRLVLNDSPVADIGPLNKLSIRQLLAGRTRISDLTPLKGMPFEELQLEETAVRDLEPIRGAPIRGLNLTYCRQVADVSPLKGMPLTWLLLRGTAVRDLSPLRGLPLKSLNLEECLNLTDLSPLADCRDLEDLRLPVQCREVGYLRDLPNLRMLSYPGANTYAEDFWKQHDAGKLGSEAK